MTRFDRRMISRRPSVYPFGKDFIYPPRRGITCQKLSLDGCPIYKDACIYTSVNKNSKGTRIAHPGLPHKSRSRLAPRYVLLRHSRTVTRYSTRVKVLVENRVLTLQKIFTISSIFSVSIFIPSADISGHDCEQ